MKDEYIRKQDVSDAVEESRRLNHHKDAKEACAHEYEHRHFLKILMDIEPADVVPVVRCKNCKHHAYDEIFSCYWCEYPGRVRDTTPDGFCEKGEE